MKRSTKKSVVSLALCACLLVSLCACGGSGDTNDLMAGIKPAKRKEPSAVTDAAGNASADFGLRLLSACLNEDGGNVMVSPLSVLCALSMTANGAKGETLSQMETAFGLSQDDLRAYLAAYVDSLPSTEETSFHSANSLWVNEGRIDVEKQFLQDNANYFDAGVFEAPFDGGTVGEINDWVKKNTDGMVPEILGDLPASAVMVLVNALCFDGKWESVYRKDEVHDRVFTNADGSESAVDMMYSEEFAFLRDEDAAGFLKYYEGGDYAFAALLPDEGVTVEEYAADLTGERLRELFANPLQTLVETGLPKFESDYSKELGGILADMGMEDAFDAGRADFSAMGKATSGYNIYIDLVAHRTFISVAEQGTKAGAATAVAMTEGAAAVEPNRVILSRPFLYAIIDCETATPIFLGAVTRL